MRTAIKPRSTTPANYVERVNLAVNYVVTHLRNPLRLEHVARAAGLSPFHFHRVFQVMMGETLTDFVKRLRLEKSLALMSLARRPQLSKIALACGFSSSSDFSRSFKQRFGVPPRAFDIAAWRERHAAALLGTMPVLARSHHLTKLPPQQNPDGFRVRIRDLPARTVAYIRVRKPYQGNAVENTTQRLMAWADRGGFAGNQWLGYQWDNPEIAHLADCQYYVAVEADSFQPAGEIGRFRFPPMVVAQVELRGDIHLELRALQWLYGVWLPRHGYVPDDHPGFEAWIGRPFAHGTSHFELHIQLPIRRG